MCPPFFVRFIGSTVTNCKYLYRKPKVLKKSADIHKEYKRKDGYMEQNEIKFDESLVGFCSFFDFFGSGWGWGNFSSGRKGRPQPNIFDINARQVG